MLALSSGTSTQTRINFILACLFLAMVLVLGGAARADTWSLPVVRLAAVAMLVAAIPQLDRDQWRAVRPGIIFLLAVEAVIAIQLIPLPPQFWASLPGRGLYVDALRTVGLDGVWRPLSLTPDLTLNALLAGFVPLATLLALVLLGTSLQRLLVPLLLAGIGVSALAGLVQIAGGGLYFYRITNEGAAVGFFSNRNHFALLLAAAFPLLACWCALPHPDPAFRSFRRWLALCAGAAILPLVLATGSRAGLVLAVLGIIFGVIIYRTRQSRRPRSTRRFRLRFNWQTFLPLGVGLLALGATIMLARDEALTRLLQGAGFEQRTAYLPIYLRMIGDFFPAGSGFGSFDSVFRAYEPLQSLSPEYLNQAHNDLAQILIEGGLAAGLALVAFLGWFVVRGVRIWTRKVVSPTDLLRRTGFATVFLILLASLVDYPLRTPSMSALLAIACWWMAARGGEEEAEAPPAKDGVGSREGLR
jgi:O-antigen ligase